MVNEKKLKFILPESISHENVSFLLREIQNHMQKDSNIIDFAQVTRIDTFGVSLLNHIKKSFKSVSFINIRPEVSELLNTFYSPAQRSDSDKQDDSTGNILEYIIEKFSGLKKSTLEYLSLLADEIYYTVQYIFKKRGIPPGEISNQLFLMAYDSFPIVCLVSFLIGVTISITSLDQLKQLGADIYLADLVGFAMIRELVPLMAGIILAGKIGASITAEISSMKVMEEIDALKTMGLVPEKFLMVPRLIAITVAIPLLVGMADLVGIVGGLLVAKIFSDIPGSVFLEQIFKAVHFSDFLIGLIKTMVFGWVVVISAGYKGFSVGRGAAGVGIATTQSVVMSISLIIVLDCIFAIILY